MRFGNIVRRSGKLGPPPSSVRKLVTLAPSSCYGSAAQSRPSGGCHRPKHPLAQTSRPMATAAPYQVGAIPSLSIPERAFGVFAYQLTIIGLNALQSTLTKNRALTLLQSTLTKTLDLKSIRINTYKKTGGEGVGEADPGAVSPYRRPRQRALRSFWRTCAVIETNAASPRGEVPARILHACRRQPWMAAEFLTGCVPSPLGWCEKSSYPGKMMRSKS
jgi:hypothetical protein